MRDGAEAPPDWSPELRARLSALRLSPEREAEIVEEMSQHLDDRWRELVAGGAGVEGSTRAIEAELRSREALKEYMAPLRQSRQPPPITPGGSAGSFARDLRRDLRYACRALAARPTFTAVAVLSLALGIGANTAIFSVINALVLRPVPGVERPAGLVRLTNGNFSYRAHEELAKREVFAATAAFAQRRVATNVNGSTQWSQVVFASGDYHRAVGVGAILGRTLTAEDERARSPVAVLSHDYWMRAFAGDAKVLGKTIDLRRMPVTIVGVTPQGFTGLVVGSPDDLTVPVTLAPQLLPAERADILTRASGQWLLMLGRLSPEQSLEQADARLQSVWPDVMAAAWPYRPGSTAPTPSTALEPAATGFSGQLRAYVSPLYVLMGLVAAVLLIACANVATLLLARAAARQRELAIRIAAGASRGRIVCQLLTEAVLLAGAAAAAGALLAIAGTRLLMRFISSDDRPVLLDLQPDWRVLVFAVGTMLLTVLLFGVVPALRATRVDVASVLKEHARTLTGGTRLRSGLVVAQVALAMLLAVGAGLFISSLQRVLTVDSGFDAANVLLVRADALAAGYDGGRTPQFFTDLVERVSQLPDVRSAALSWVPPVSHGASSGGPVGVEGLADSPDPRALYNWVSPRYFETITQQLVAGRPFTAQDGPNAPAVAVVNESFARHFLGNENPIGKKLDPRGGSDFTMEIVGVVRDASYSELKDEPRRVFYAPYAQWSTLLQTDNMVLEVRSTLAADVLAREVRQVVAQLDDTVIVETETLRHHVDDSIARDRLLAQLSGLLGGISLLLVAIGLYGVMAYSVAQRTWEIGIRMALGAESRTVLSMVLRDAFRLVAAGTVVGVVAALGTSRLIASLLFGVGPRDMTAFLAAAVVMALVALLASLLPARRAARIDPIVALRYE